MQDIDIHKDYFQVINNKKDKLLIKIEYNIYSCKYWNFDEPAYFNNKHYFIYSNNAIVQFVSNKDHLHDVQFLWKNKNNEEIFTNLGTFNSNSTVKVKVKESDINSLFFAVGYNIKKIGSIHDSYLVYSDDYKNIIDTLTDYIKSIQKVQSSFEINYKYSKYFFIFVDLNKNVSTAGSAFWGSAFWGSDFFYQVMSFQQNRNLFYNLKYIIAHEYAHRLIGAGLQSSPYKQKDHCWFIEGVTDFFSNYLNYLGGIYNKQEFLNFYNNNLYKYYMLNMSRLDLRHTYSNFDFELAGYVRGMMFAIKLDNMIKNKDPNKSFLDFLKYYLSSQNQNSLFNNRQFNEYFKKYIEIDVLQLIETMISGAKDNDFLLPSKILDEKFCLTYTKFKQPIYPIKLFETFQKFKIIINENAINKININDINPNGHISYISTINLNDKDNDNAIKFIIDGKTLIVKPYKYLDIYIPKYIRMR